MNLIDIARADAHRYSSSPGEWGASVFFEAPTGENATIMCRVNEHHLVISAEGTPVNSKQSSVCFSEYAFINTGYPLRNADGHVALEGHKVSWANSTGQVRKYLIVQWFPDNTLGYIACTLTDFQ